MRLYDVRTDPHRRWWDGLTRRVISARHVRITGTSPVRIELLSCGHEQAFTGGLRDDTNKRAGGGMGQSPRQFRVCKICDDLGWIGDSYERDDLLSSLNR